MGELWEPPDVRLNNDLMQEHEQRTRVFRDARSRSPPGPSKPRVADPFDDPFPESETQHPPLQYGGGANPSPAINEELRTTA